MIFLKYGHTGNKVKHKKEINFFVLVGHNRFFKNEILHDCISIRSIASIYFSKASIFCFFNFILFFLNSCTDPVKPLPIIPDPSIQTLEINADNLATHFYSLSEKKIISSHKITDWDLRLCAQTDKYYFYLNTAKNMRIAKYNGNFSDSIKLSTITKWQTDIVKDGKAYTAMGNWGDFSFPNPKSYGYTYVIDLGYLNIVEEFGYRKIEILGCSGNYYLIKYGMLNDAYGDTLKIEKKTNYNNIYVLLQAKAKEVDIEPPAAAWDLAFTQYGLHSPVIKDGIAIDTVYSWTDMILLNTSGRQLACDTLKRFDDITFWDAEKYNFGNSFDYIGNKWRAFNLMSKRYEISNKKIYILKTTDNHLYKIELLAVDKSNGRRTIIEFKVKNL